MKVNYIELLKQKHPICFSLSASEEIVEEFGSFEGMTDSLTGSAKEKFQAVDKMLSILLKEGRNYCGLLGEELPEPLPCRPAELIGVDEVPEITHAIFSLVREDGAQTVEAAGKNAGATQDG